MFIFISIFVLIAAAVIYGQLKAAKKYRELLESVTSEDRGTRAERDLVVALLENGISPKAIFHDLYVKNKIVDFHK
jgi:hypothetical protein